MQAYCLAPAGGSGDVQASWDAIRLRMTAEEVSMPRAPKAAWRTVNHSVRREQHTSRRFACHSAARCTDNPDSCCMLANNLLQTLA